MVHVPSMTELVNHQVSNQRRVEEQQAVVDTDRTAAGVAAPAGALTTHVHRLEWISGLHREYVQPWSKFFFGKRCEPAFECTDTEFFVAGATAENDKVIF